MSNLVRNRDQQVDDAFVGVKVVTDRIENRLDSFLVVTNSDRLSIWLFALVAVSGTGLAHLMAVMAGVEIGPPESLQAATFTMHAFGCLAAALLLGFTLICADTKKWWGLTLKGWLRLSVCLLFSSTVLNAFVVWATNGERHGRGINATGGAVDQLIATPANIAGAICLTAVMVVNVVICWRKETV